VTVPEKILKEFTGDVVWDEHQVRIEVYNGTPEMERMIRWAVERFVGAGIGAPDVDEVVFLSYRTKCSSYQGFTVDDDGWDIVSLCFETNDACTDPACTAWQLNDELTLLHEFAHVWLAEHVDTAGQERFMAHEGIARWNDSADPWDMRGQERAANAIAVAMAGDLGVDGCDIPHYCDASPGAYEILVAATPTARVTMTG
jgi:hypothetical protein